MFYFVYPFLNYMLVLVVWLVSWAKTFQKMFDKKSQEFLLISIYGRWYLIVGLHLKLSTCFLFFIIDYVKAVVVMVFLVLERTVNYRGSLYTLGGTVVHKILMFRHTPRARHWSSSWGWFREFSEFFCFFFFSFFKVWKSHKKFDTESLEFSHSLLCIWKITSSLSIFSFRHVTT